MNYLVNSSNIIYDVFLFIYYNYVLRVKCSFCLSVTNFDGGICICWLYKLDSFISQLIGDDWILNDTFFFNFH